MVNRWDLSLYWPWTSSHYLKCFNTHASVNAKIIESLLFHFISLSPSFSFTSATLQRQHRSRNSDQNSLNPWLLQTMPGLPDSSLEVEFRALCAKRKPPFSFSLFHAQMLRQRLEAVLTKGTFTMLEELPEVSVWVRLWTVKCESAFRGSCSPQTGRTSTLTWFQMEEVEGQTQPPFFVRVPPFLFKAIVCNKWSFLPLRVERCFGLLFKCHKDVWFILAGYTTLE